MYRYRPFRWRATVTALAVGALALSACSSSSQSSTNTSSPAGTTSKAAAASSAGGAKVTASGPLTVLIGSSGDAETNAVNAAVAAWSTKTGIKANVVNASNLAQQLSQGFASGKPADVFYLSNDSVASFAKNGSLAPLDDLSNVGTFYDSLKKAYSYNGHLYAAPKDFSTLALVINQDAWTKAGLTNSDIPTTWDQLETVAKKLTTGKQVGLTFGPQFERMGVFMAEAGGWLTSSDGKTATVNSAQNIEAFNYVKKLLSDGCLKFSSDLGTGWGGEAFGKQLAAMTIEGNWIVGAMTKDYPNVKYKVVELPAGPNGKGTIQYDGGWGVAADSPNKAAAKDLVEFLTAPEQEMAFAKAFGVMPSVQSIADQWKQVYPDQTAFLDGAAYSKSIPNVAGISTIVTDFDSQLQGLAKTDPKTILDKVQHDLQGILNQ